MAGRADCADAAVTAVGTASDAAMATAEVAAIRTSGRSRSALLTEDLLTEAPVPHSRVYNALYIT
jgi:hypothetical protein